MVPQIYKAIKELTNGQKEVADGEREIIFRTR